MLAKDRDEVECDLFTLDNSSVLDLSRGHFEELGLW